MRKRISCILILAGPFCFATTGGAGTQGDPCEVGLTALDAAATAADLKRLKLNESLIHRAEGEDRALLDAVIGVLRKLDEDLLSEIARYMIEDPPPSADINQNPFFIAHPREVRPQTLINYEIMRDNFAGRLTPFEIGLIAASLPQHPRAKENFESTEREDFRFYKATVDRIKAMIAHPEYRPAFIAYFEALLRDGSIATKAAELVADIESPAVQNSYSPAGIENTLNRAKKGMVSDKGAVTFKILNHMAMEQIFELARSSAEGRELPFALDDEASEENFLRSFIRPVAETFLTQELGLHLNSGALTSVFSTLNFLDPLPLAPKILRANIVTYLSRFVDPIRLRLAPKVAAPEKTVLVPRPRTTHELQLTDLFTPPPTGKKALRQNAPKTPENSATSSDGIPFIEKHKDLHQFTSLHASPRPVAELESRKVYEFWYVRDRTFRRRTIRFGPDALGWMIENAVQARKLLNAIHLGETRGQLNGIKMLEGRPRRFDAPVYEVKIHGKFRALLLRVDDCWQVIKISHKDTAAHDQEWLLPLKD